MLNTDGDAAKAEDAEQPWRRQRDRMQTKTVHESLRTAYLLTMVLVSLMGVQAVLGLLFQAQYRDADWITATWFGNDWFTLVVAVPMFAVALMSAGRGSIRGLLLWVGMLGYGVYNYAYYLFGAALNAFFPLYVLICVLSSVTLILVLSRMEVESRHRRVRAGHTGTAGRRLSRSLWA